MAGNVLTVLLEGKPIGHLERLANGRLQLHYEEAYQQNPSSTPLSVSMQPMLALHPDAHCSPWLWGLLPDNAEVLARWGREFGVSVASPFTILGTQIGHDCAGAVQFCPPEMVAQLLEVPGDIAWLTEGQIADRLRMLRADSTSWLGPEFIGQFSLGGAQAKTALHRAGGEWGASSGSTPTTHILKPAISGFEAHDINEHICLAAARWLGLSAAATRIETFEDMRAIVVERFDRRIQDGALVRIHQEDLCQALSVPPGRKYQADGGPTPGQIAEVLRSVIPGPNAELDVARFADALAFNWLIAGTDAHAKNYSLLLSGAQARLAPLYDIASILPYDDSDGYRVRLAMKVGDDYKLHRTDRAAAWRHAAEEMKLEPRRLVERILNLAERIPEAFAQAAAAPEISELQTDLPERLVTLVSKRAERCIAVLS